MWCLPFSVWFTSFSITIFKSIHINANGNILLFYGWVVFHCIHVPIFFIHSSVDGHLGCFPFQLLEETIIQKIHVPMFILALFTVSRHGSILELLVFDMLLLPPKFLVSESIRHGHSSLFVFHCSVTKLCLTLCSPLG